MKVNPYLTLYKTTKPKWIKHVNVKPETVKLLEQKMDRKLSDQS